MEGFQVTPLWHQGSIRDDGRHEFPFVYQILPIEI